MDKRRQSTQLYLRLSIRKSSGPDERLKIPIPADAAKVVISPPKTSGRVPTPSSANTTMKNDAKTVKGVISQETKGSKQTPTSSQIPKQPLVNVNKANLLKVLSHIQLRLPSQEHCKPGVRSSPDVASSTHHKSAKIIHNGTILYSNTNRNSK